MTKDTRFVTGCFVAPLAAPLVLLLITMVIGEDMRGPSYEYGFNDYFELVGIAGLFLMVGGPIAYAITILFGLPVYWITNRLGFVNFWTVSLGAAFVAILPVLLMTAHHGFIIYYMEDPPRSSWPPYLMLMLAGFVVGVLFWYVSGLNRAAASRKRAQPTSSAPLLGGENTAET